MREPKKFEVLSHQWIDLTDASGDFGATILTDCKNGSDKPNDNTIRLTLIRTPGTRGGYARPGHPGHRPSRIRLTASPGTPVTGASSKPTGRASGSTIR